MLRHMHNIIQKYNDNDDGKGQDRRLLEWEMNSHFLHNRDKTMNYNDAHSMQAHMCMCHMHAAYISRQPCGQVFLDLSVTKPYFA